MTWLLRLLGVLTLTVLALSSSACSGRSLPGAPTAAAQVSADELLLSLPDVRRISGFDGFVRAFQSDRPKPDEASAPQCRALFDQNVVFADGWTEFRFVSDEGDLDTGGRIPLRAVASQAIATYPGAAAARDVFDRRLPALAGCIARQIPFYNPTMSQPDGDTVVLQTRDWAVMSVVRSDTIVEVTVTGLPVGARVASDMAAAINRRLP